MKVVLILTTNSRQESELGYFSKCRNIPLIIKKNSVDVFLFECDMVTHPGFESDEFKNHFHGEDSSEDHVENVHYIVERC